MDTQLVAEKLFKFCKEKYPDLKWDIKFVRKDSTYIYGSDSFIELTLRVHKECEFEYILGSSKILPPMLWLGTFHVWINFEKDSDIDFTLYETDKIWNEKDWLLSKQS